MPIVIGALFALPGGLAALAGLCGMHRVRRLRRHGLPAWAMILPPRAIEESLRDGSRAQTLMQYVLADGRVIERICPAAARAAARRGSGQQLLVRYDPSDPQDILVHAREGWYADRAFVAVGALFIVIGIWIAALGH
jgi:hypothetical protein